MIMIDNNCPQPPGPGLQLQAPSVYISIVFCVMITTPWMDSSFFLAFRTEYDKFKIYPLLYLGGETVVEKLEVLTEDSRHVGKSCAKCEQKLEIGAEIVECPRCHAVHHADFWKQNGG